MKDIKTDSLWLMRGDCLDRMKEIPDYCVAFPGGNGTKMMKELCENHGIPVWEPYV